MLCMYCEALSIGLIRTGFLKHRISLNDLHCSATNGCDGCSIIHESFALSLSGIGLCICPLREWACMGACKTVHPVIIRKFNEAPPPGCSYDPDTRIEVFCGKLNSFLTLATDNGVCEHCLWCKAANESGTDNPASKYVTGRVQTIDSASPQTYLKIESWIRECNSSHKKCGFGKSTRLPTRVLEVPPRGTSGRRVRLHISADEETGDYVALSYCWGTTKQVTTTQSNLESHTRGICADSLPKTIRDAISVTRDLGIRFLWVDALCIVQDFLERERLAYRMFADERAAVAEDANAGFLHPRGRGGTNKSFKKIYCIENGSELGHVYVQPSTVIRTGYLDHRAWAFQERRLSRRVLDYRQGLISLTCRSGTMRETSSRFTALEDENFRLGSHPIDVSSYGREDVLRQWYASVEDYSVRSMTYQTDKLPALSGYAHAAHTVVGGDYLAGIWKEDILRGLLWLAGDGWRLKKPYYKRAPSWSWAALDGTIDYSLCWRYHEKKEDFVLRLKVIRSHVSTSGFDSMGEVTSGMLVVSAHIQKAVWLPPGDKMRTWEPNGFLPRKDIAKWDLLGNLDEGGTSTCFSLVRRLTRSLDKETKYALIPTDIMGRPVAICRFDTLGARPKYVWCLAVVSTRGLVLEYLAKQKVYRRIGFYALLYDVWTSRSPLATVTIV